MDTIVKAITDHFFSFFLNWLSELALSTAEFMINLINALTFSFWDNEYVKLILDFGTWIGWGVFAIALVVALIDLAEERATGQPVDFTILFTNIVKGIAFISFARWVALWSLQLIAQLTNYIGTALDYARIEDGLKGIYTGIDIIDGPFNVFLIFILALVVDIAGLYFILQSFKRFGAMFIHIMQIPLYVPDILRGDTTKMGEWLRQMAAIAVTYGFQYICFYLGCTLLMEGQVLVALPLWLVCGQIPKMLNRYGWSTGSTGKFSQVAQTGFNLITTAK